MPPSHSGSVNDDIRCVRNPRAAARTDAYGSERSMILNADGFAEAFGEIATWPDYAASPLISLPGLAAALGLASIDYKDERPRFGLGSFKALGGAYAVGQLLRRKLRKAGAQGRLDSVELLSGVHAAWIREETVCCATDGNHGRSVAWGARLFGCHCVIFVHPHVSPARRNAIAQFGAQVIEVPGNYDDAVRHAAAQAATNGWTVVSDTSYPGYRQIPIDVMHGYGVLAAETGRQWRGATPPTHVFLQTGVGALAAALCAEFWLRWGAQRPRCVIVEPLMADCVFRSIERGRKTAVSGSLDTVMAGLACGEVSDLAWGVLEQGTHSVIAIDDRYALQAMRRLAAPIADDPPIVAGETGGSGLAAVLALAEHPELARCVELDTQSRILLIGSEGDTDPDIYREVVGRSATAVLKT